MNSYGSYGAESKATALTCSLSLGFQAALAETAAPPCQGRSDRPDLPHRSETSTPDEAPACPSPCDRPHWSPTSVCRWINDTSFCTPGWIPVSSLCFYILSSHTIKENSTVGSVQCERRWHHIICCLGHADADLFGEPRFTPLFTFMSLSCVTY